MNCTIIGGYFKEGITYIVPLIALLLSIISLCKSLKGQQLQNRVGELELKLREYEVSELDKKKAAASSACVEARVIRISKGRYRLKVWNSGQITAYKVSVIFDCENGPMIISSKMPFEFLDAGKNFEESLSVCFGTAEKFKIIATWEDADRQTHQKEQMGSL